MKEGIFFQNKTVPHLAFVFGFEVSPLMTDYSTFL